LYINDQYSAGTVRTGLQISPYLSGNITTAQGFYVQSPSPGANSLTNWTGLSVDAANGVGTGTNKGVEVANVAAATNNYAIYSGAAAQSYFAGSVGIGVTSPAYKLDVNGSLNLSTGNALRINGVSICTSAGCTSSSDRRLKENILPLKDSLEKILQLEGVQYDWKDKQRFSDKHQIGLIAQDVEKVYPEVVVTDSKSGLKAIAYDHLIAPVIEAIKTLHSKINQLFEASENRNKEIEALKAENARLKTRLDRIERSIQSK
jgi:hypothetical protein